MRSAGCSRDSRDRKSCAPPLPASRGMRPGGVWRNKSSIAIRTSSSVATSAQSPMKAISACKESEIHQHSGKIFSVARDQHQVFAATNQSTFALPA